MSNHTAGWAWWVLFGWVGGYDTWALLRGRETLSGALWRWLSDRRQRWLVVAIYCTLTKHSFTPHVLERYDPLNNASMLLQKVAKMHEQRL